MIEIVDQAIVLLERKESFVLATLVRQDGSAPREAGACMIVKGDGSIAGTVGGGALEGKVQRLAAEVLQRQEAMLMDFNLTQNDLDKLGMICGGQGTVLIDYIDATNLRYLEIYRQLAEMRRSNGRGWLVTFIPNTESDLKARKQCLFKADGSIVGEMAWSASLAELGGQIGKYHRFTVLDNVLVAIEPVGNYGTALIFGAGHVGQKLAPVLASVDFKIVVLDDRTEFANRERFATADRIVVPDSFNEVFSHLDVDEHSFIIIVTRGHAHDRTVLEQALRTNAGYIGMIGSRTKCGLTFQALLDNGFTREDLDRVHAPIGITIKAQTPEEIAISIAAELIQARAEMNQ